MDSWRSWSKQAPKGAAISRRSLLFALATGLSPVVELGSNLVIGSFADWFNSRRWFIRYLLYAEWVILVTFVALIVAMSS
jgi:hypothetical protein